MAPPNPISDSISSATLPVFDLSRWTTTSASGADRQIVARELVKACHDTGFVYIINHGVSTSLLDEVFGISKKFFELSREEKMEAHEAGLGSFRGYSFPGHEKTASLEEHPNGEKITDESPDEAINFSVQSLPIYALFSGIENNLGIIWNRKRQRSLRQKHLAPRCYPPRPPRTDHEVLLGMLEHLAKDPASPRRRTRFRRRELPIEVPFWK